MLKFQNSHFSVVYVFFQQYEPTTCRHVAGSSGQNTTWTLYSQSSHKTTVIRMRLYYQGPRCYEHCYITDCYVLF